MDTRIVVRLTSSAYFSGETVTYKKVIRLLKRESTGSLYDLICDIDYDKIININQLEDGKYLLEPTNIEYDTYNENIVDSYDLHLVPFTPLKKNKEKPWTI